MCVHESTGFWNPTTDKNCSYDKCQIKMAVKYCTEKYILITSTLHNINICYAVQVPL